VIVHASSALTSGGAYSSKVDCYLSKSSRSVNKKHHKGSFFFARAPNFASTVVRAALEREISLLGRRSEGPTGVFGREKILYNLRRVLYSASRIVGNEAPRRVPSFSLLLSGS